MHPFEKLTVPKDGVGIHWFGQSSFALKDASGTILLIDPYFPHRRSPEKFVHSAPPLSEADLRIDFVVLTHEHGDHTCPESLRRIHDAHPLARYFGPAESIGRLRELNIPAEQLTVMAAGDAQWAGPALLHAVFSKPPFGAPRDGIPAPDVEHLGFVIEFGGARIYVSGDPIFTLAKHDELLAPILALKPDIGLLTTHPTEGEFPDFAGSAELARKLGLKVAVPAHYDCFVERTYDPFTWAAGFHGAGPKPHIIAYDDSMVYLPV